MPKIKIKKLTKTTPSLQQQTAAISTLAAEIWREHYTPIIGAAQVEYMLQKFQSPQQIHTDITQNNYIYYTAAAPQSPPIAYAAAQPRDTHLFLSKIYVQANHRNKGIARALFAEITALNHPTIRLTVNINNHIAIAAYKKLGFTTINTVKADIGGGFFMDDYIMEYTNPNLCYN